MDTSATHPHPKHTPGKPDIDVSDMEKKSHTDSEAFEAGVPDAEEDSMGWKPTAEEHAVEKKLRRKLDLLLLPVLTIVYLFNSLDKGNIGYAKTDTLERDLHLHGQQYYLTTMIFYVPFCLCGVPLALVIKRFSAARVLPILMLGFGSISLLTVAAHNFAGLMTLRLLLGICESPMLPGVVFYLSTFYTRGELASRIGIFYAAASISGAFSGLIAYGVFHIKHPHLSGWKILFLIEGAATVAFAFFAYAVLPRNIKHVKFFSQREKEVALKRITLDSSASANEKLDIRDAFRPFVDWRYAVWALISLSFGIPLVSVNTFLPQIVQRLGYNKLKTSLYTVAPNVAGTVFLVIVTQSSDRFRERGLHICGCLVIGLVGWIVLAVVDPTNVHANYGAMFLVAMGAFAPSVLTATWYSNNTASESHRAVLAAVMVAVANSAGLVSTNIFRAEWSPKFTPSLAISAGAAALCLVTCLTWTTYMRIDNRRRNRRLGTPGRRPQDVSTKALAGGWASEEFLWQP
ncbi:unnamed protein product [Parajaminaea phylloscopi]